MLPSQKGIKTLLIKKYMAKKPCRIFAKLINVLFTSQLFNLNSAVEAMFVIVIYKKIILFS
jgi:hypothetical protein